MTEKAFITSGRNTIIHKIRKLDLLVTNGGDNPPILVTYKGIKQFEGKVPDNKELVDVTTNDVFGDEKTLVFIQTLNGKEYKIDYSKIGTSMFIKIHQDSFF